MAQCTSRPWVDYNLGRPEWRVCTDPVRMLHFLKRRLSDRQRRLLACAACRLVPQIARDPLAIEALAVAERFADQQASPRELAAAAGAIDYVYRQSPAPAFAAVHAACSSVVHGGRVLQQLVFTRLESVPRMGGGQRLKALQAIREAEGVAQASLLRHFVGDPFKPHLAVTVNHWPTTVLDVAAALYDGGDCAFALQDALVEGGHANLAQHFRKKRAHPKGCWALDILLGKE